MNIMTSKYCYWNNVRETTNQTDSVLEKKIQIILQYQHIVEKYDCTKLSTYINIYSTGICVTITYTLIQPGNIESI